MRVIDLREIFRCPCVQLGQGDGEPGRKRIDSHNRFVTVLENCRICHGTGKPSETPEERYERAQEEARTEARQRQAQLDDAGYLAWVANNGRAT